MSSVMQILLWLAQFGVLSQALASHPLNSTVELLATRIPHPVFPTHSVHHKSFPSSEVSIYRTIGRNNATTTTITETLVTSLVKGPLTTPIQTVILDDYPHLPPYHNPTSTRLHHEARDNKAYITLSGTRQRHFIPSQTLTTVAPGQVSITPQQKGAGCELRILNEAIYLLLSCGYPDLDIALLNPLAIPECFQKVTESVHGVTPFGYKLLTPCIGEALWQVFRECVGWSEKIYDVKGWLEECHWNRENGGPSTEEVQCVREKIAANAGPDAKDVGGPQCLANVLWRDAFGQDW